MFWEDNPKTKHLYVDKCGFIIEGVLRDEYFHKGKYHNIVRIALLEKEYREQISPAEVNK